MRLSWLAPGDRREVFAAIHEGRVVSDPRLASATRNEAARLVRSSRRAYWAFVGVAVLAVVEVIATLMGAHLTLGIVRMDGRISGSLNAVVYSLVAVGYRRMGKRAKQAEQANAAGDDSTSCPPQV